MDIVTPGIEESLVIEKNHQKILKPYKSKIQHATDLGIHAPRSVSIDLEEIRILKPLKKRVILTSHRLICEK